MRRSWLVITLTFLWAFWLVPADNLQAKPLPQSVGTIYINHLQIQSTNTMDSTWYPTMVELADGGVGATALDGLTLLFLHSADDSTTVVAALDLSPYTTADNGLLQLTVDQDFAPPSGTVNSLALIATPTLALTEGTPFDLVEPFSPVFDGVRFSPNGGTVRSVAGDDPLQFETMADIADAHRADLPSAAAMAATTAESTACGTEATPIHVVQGKGAFSELNGSVVTVEAIVVGDFQDTSRQLRGFFLQEEAADFDDDPATSEGIYVFDNGFGVDVNAGDRVRVRGQVAEYNTLTELKRIETVEICDSDNPIEAIPVAFPLPTADAMEQYEGMLVRLTSPMLVAQNYFLGRYGQITLVAGGRAYQPTNLFPPGSPEAIALAAENRARLIVLDDGQDLRALGDNPDPVPYLGTPDTTIIRAGDAITNVVGVIDYGRINSAPGDEVGLGYRIQPVAEPTFTTANPRATTPPTVGGSVKVTGFNVLNYFNGNGSGGGYPTERGAKTGAEFDRQRDKIITALSAMQADVIGLMEIENDGYGPESALQDLVNGLNQATAERDSTAEYVFVDPGLDRLGADAIAVGIIYNTTTVTPIGSPATLTTGAFDQELADFGRSRQPLVQTFETADGERFTVVVNHFKSKRPSGEPDEANIDSGNGTGAWNGRRTEAAQDLLAWLATDPTASNDPDFLILGDLNAYAKEPPITTFEEAGYVNLIAHYGGSEAYSYVYDGQLGYLDHALASSTLFSQTTGAMDWHINADEAKVLDYDARFNPPQYYAPDPFRASDHDPVIVGLALGSDSGEQPGGEPLVNEAFAYSVLPGESLSRIARRFSVTIPALAEANGLYPWSVIYPNQQLTIPPVAAEVRCIRTIYAEPGESFTALAERFGSDPERLAIANGFASIALPDAEQPVCLPRIY